MQRIALRGRDGEEQIEEQLLQEHTHLYDSMFDQIRQPVYYLDGHQTIQNLSDQLVSLARYLSHSSYAVRAAPIPVVAMRDGPAKRVRSMEALTKLTEREVIVIDSDDENSGPATKKRMVSERERRTSHKGSAGPSRVGPAEHGLQGMGSHQLGDGQGLPPPQEETQRTIPEFFSQIPPPATALASVLHATASGPGIQQSDRVGGKKGRAEYVSLADTTETTDSNEGTSVTSSENDFSSDDNDTPIQILNNADVVDTLACSKCRGKDDEANLLVCDVCNKATHRTCLTRPLHSVPTGAWACEACTKKGDKGVLDITDDADVLEYLRSGNMPSKVGIDKRQRRALCKRISKRAQGYWVINGVLFRKPSKTYPRNRRVPSIPDRTAVIQKCHDECGHYGASKTMYMVAKNCFWPGMSIDVRRHVAQCHQCQRQKPVFKEKATLSPLPISKLMERFSVDLCGPLQLTAKGNTYLAICVESFSRWVVAAALPNRLSATVADFFHQRVILQFGAPVEVRSDNGSEFDLNFSDLLQKYGIVHRHSAPHTPSQNGLAERYVGVIVNSIKRSMESHLADWDNYIGEAVAGNNFSKNASTGFSPFYLMFGREARYGDSSDFEAANYRSQLDNAVGERTEQLQDASVAAEENIKKAQGKMVRDYERRRPMDPKQDIPVGSLVMIKVHKKGNKLKAKSEGPYLLKAYNKNQTLAVVEDSDNRQWTETVSFISQYHKAQENNKNEEPK
jgi:transposase InsO family protein